MVGWDSCATGVQTTRHPKFNAVGGGGSGIKIANVQHVKFLLLKLPDLGYTDMKLSEGLN
jgi:hypothetical protein